MDDEEKKNRIDSMLANKGKAENLSDEYKEFLKFKAWKR